MTARIVVEPMERSLPTSVPYRSDRIASRRFERDVPDNLLFDPATEDWIRKCRSAQLADLDYQEELLRAKYDMAAPDKPGDREARIQAARRAQGLIDAKDAAAQAPAARTTPPPSALRDVSDGTIDELRRIGARLADLGKPYEGPMPASEADAEALVVKLRGQLHALQQPAQAPAPKPDAAFYGPASEPAKVAPAQAAPKYGPASSVAPAARRCVDASHGREPRPITSAEWDFSVQRFGRPLCRQHQHGGR